MKRNLRTDKSKVIDELKPISINNINDIRRAVVPFMKDIPDNKVDIEAEVDWVDDDDGGKHSTNVKSYSSDTSIRKGLIDGFEHVKEQQKMWDRLYDALDDDEYGATLNRVSIDNMELPIDRIIRYRLGGKRKGLTVRWEINNKTVVFDPYSKKLEIME